MMPADRERLREKIAVALDLPEASEALALARRLEGRVRWLKIGLQLFTASGGPLVSELARAGHQVFLDLKLHDIPNTVSAAAVEGLRHGAAMMTVHASGGVRMMRSAAESLARESRRAGLPRPRLLAVTALTSMDEEDLAAIGLLGPMEEMVVRLAALALRAGCDGVVCSPREASRVRGRCGAGFFVVTPGIRPHWLETGSPPFPADDQKRVAGPAEALSAGADLLVVGRPVTGAPDPAAAIERLLDEIEACAASPP